MPPEQIPAQQILQRLRWTLLRPLATRLNGDERSRQLGAGIEFAGVRDYQPGDDVRHLDWSVTARAGRPFVRVSQAERTLDVWLMVDISPSVDWGTGTCLKRYRAIELAAAAGQLLGRHGNRLGLLLFAEKPLGIVPPAAGRVHLERVVSRLRLEPRRVSHGATDLTAALATMQRLARRPALILLASDFLVKGEDWTAPLRGLAQRHEVVAAVLRDPRESCLPDVGVVTFEDPETGEQLTVDTGGRRLRERFAAAAVAQTRHLTDTLAACGVDRLTLSTDTPLLTALAAFLEGRRRSRPRLPAAPAVRVA